MRIRTSSGQCFPHPTSTKCVSDSKHTDPGSIDSSNAFITPQWGGVVIHNPPSSPASADLSPSFNLFTTQLHTLLGVPPSPFPTSTSLLAAWQVDALIRRRLAEATKETIDTLQAIVTLVRDIPNMRVGPAVQRGVQNSLASLARVRWPPPSLPASLRAR